MISRLINYAITRTHIGFFTYNRVPRSIVEERYLLNEDGSLGPCIQKSEFQWLGGLKAGKMTFQNDGQAPWTYAFYPKFKAPRENRNPIDLRWLLYENQRPNLEDSSHELWETVEEKFPEVPALFQHELEMIRRGNGIISVFRMIGPAKTKSGDTFNWRYDKAPGPVLMEVKRQKDQIPSWELKAGFYTNMKLKTNMRTYQKQKEDRYPHGNFHYDYKIKEQDEQGNWTVIQETVNGVRYLTKRTTTAYKFTRATAAAKPMITPLDPAPPSLFAPYFDSLPKAPKVDLPKKSSSKLEGYYWIAGQWTFDPDYLPIDGPYGKFLKYFYSAFFKGFFNVQTMWDNIMVEGPHTILPTDDRKLWYNLDSEFYVFEKEIRFYRAPYNQNDKVSNHQEKNLMALQPPFKIKSPKLPTQQEIDKAFTFDWKNSFARDSRNNDKAIAKALELETRIHFWKTIAQYQPLRYLNEGKDHFCFVTQFESDIDLIIQEKNYVTSYERGYQKFI